MRNKNFLFSECRYLAPNENYVALALAIIQKAALDLHSSNPACAAEARAWLVLIGIDWCQMLGVSESQLAAWAKKGYTIPFSSHRNWRY